MLSLLLAAAVCSSVKACSAASHAALRAGNLARAEKTALIGLRLAECAPDGPESDAVEVMARVALRRGEPLMARAWLGGQPDDPALKATVDAAVARMPADGGHGGRYSQDQEAGLWNHVWVTAAAADHIHFQLEGLRVSRGRCQEPERLTDGDLSTSVPGVASLEGDAARQGEVFAYESREFVVNDDDRPCRLTFRFTPQGLTLEQDTRGEDCGFGYGVNVAGDYVRTK